MKCTQFEFGWVSAPDHAWGAYSLPLQTLYLDFRGLLLRPREGKGHRTGMEGNGKVRKKGE